MLQRSRCFPQLAQCKFAVGPSPARGSSVGDSVSLTCELKYTAGDP